MNLVSLYGGTRATHQPNPVVGEVNSLRAARIFEEQAPHRLFGANAGATCPPSGTKGAEGSEGAGGTAGAAAASGTEGAADVAEPAQD